MFRLRSSVAAASKMMRMITASSLSSPQPLSRSNISISISPPQMNPIRPFGSTSPGSRFFSTRGRSRKMSFKSDDEGEDEIEDVSTASESDGLYAKIRRFEEDSYPLLQEIKEDLDARYEKIKDDPDAEIKKKYVDALYAKIKRFMDTANIKMIGENPFAHYDEKINMIEEGIVYWYAKSKTYPLCYQTEIKMIEEEVADWYAEVERNNACYEADMKKIHEDLYLYYAKIKRIQEEGWYGKMRRIEDDLGDCYGLTKWTPMYLNDAENRKIKKDFHAYYKNIKANKAESRYRKRKRIEEDPDDCFAKINKIQEDLDACYAKIKRIIDVASEAKIKRTQEEGDARYAKIERIQEEIEKIVRIEINKIKKDPDPCSSDIEDIIACHRKIDKIKEESSFEVKVIIERRMFERLRERGIPAPR